MTSYSLLTRRRYLTVLRRCRSIVLSSLVMVTISVPALAGSEPAVSRSINIAQYDLANPVDLHQLRRRVMRTALAVCETSGVAGMATYVRSSECVAAARARASNQIAKRMQWQRVATSSRP